MDIENNGAFIPKGSREGRKTPAFRPVSLIRRINGSYDVVATRCRAPPFMQQSINFKNSIKINVLEAYKFRIYLAKSQKPRWSGL